MKSLTGQCHSTVDKQSSHEFVYRRIQMLDLWLPVFR